MGLISACQIPILKPIHRERTLPFVKTPFGSNMRIHPRRQPGTSHLLESPPNVRTGTLRAKDAIGK